jgi:predicted PurR-regulated permease PerM
LVRSKNVQTSSQLLTIIAIVLVVASLYLGRQILIPLALALVLSFLLTPFVMWVEKCHVRRVPAVVVVLTLSVAVIGLLSWVISGQLMEITAQLPNYGANIHAKLESIHDQKEGRLNKASSTIKRLNQELSTPQTKAPQTVGRNPVRRELVSGATAHPISVQVAKPPSSALEYLTALLGPLVGPARTVGIVIVFTLFMLVKREDLRNRAIRLAGQGRLSVMTQALDDAARRLSRYLLLQFLVNLSYGSLFGLGLYFIGVPHASLWGFLAGLLRFVPYLGALAAAACPMAMAFAVFPGWTQVALTFSLFVALELATANVIEPWLYGTQTGIASLAILVAAVFWATLWGPVGLIVSTPLTLCLMILGRYVPQLEFLEVLLGDEPVLSPDAQLYQRLLAMDSDEASEIAEAYLEQNGLESLYDSVIIPALGLAEQDRHLDALDEVKLNSIRQSTKELIEELGEHINAKAPSAGAKSNGQGSGAGRQLVNVVCLPARDETDEIIAIMLAQLLKGAGYQADSLPIGTVEEMLKEVSEHNARLVCVSALPPFVVGHARSLCRQLRMRFPGTKILVGIWGFEGGVRKAQERIPTDRADTVATTLQEAMMQVRQSVESPIPVADTRKTGEREQEPQENRIASDPA